MTPQEADRMRMAARKAGKVLAYDFHHRFALDTQLLREAVMKGTLGEIYSPRRRRYAAAVFRAGASLPTKRYRAVGR
jgi:predicted dehydrogenase